MQCVGLKFFLSGMFLRDWRMAWIWENVHPRMVEYKSRNWVQCPTLLIPTLLQRQEDDKSETKLEYAVRFCLKTKKQKLDRVGNASAENLFPSGPHLLSWDVDPIVERFALHSLFYSMVLFLNLYISPLWLRAKKSCKEAFRRQE